MKKPSGNPTLKDVATLAGVSIGTISRVLNNHRAVSPVTREKVEEAIRKLNYTPNSLARSLVTGRAQSFGLFVVQQNPIRRSAWPYELLVIQGISDFLKDKGWDLQISWCYREEINDPRFVAQMVNRRNVDGILIMSFWSIELPALLELVSRDVPFMLIGFRNPTHPIRSIEFDNAGATKQLVEYLIKLGHRDFALITGESETLHMIDRLKGFHDALSEAGLSLRNGMLRRADWSIEAGYEHMVEILRYSPHPTAVVCGNDNLAAGAIKAITEHGLSVPEDISVVGFDDSAIAEAVEPSLTTVSVPIFEMGQLAAEKLFLEVNEAQSVRDERVVLPCKIVVRDSTAPPRERRNN